MRTHYQNLKVAENASQAAIKSAYRKLCLKHHPDRNPGNPDSQRIMQILNDAYDVLSDPVKRRAYDQDLVLKRARESRPQNATAERSRASAQRSERRTPYPFQYRTPQSHAQGTPFSYGPPPWSSRTRSRPAPRNGFQWFMQETGITYGMLFVFFCLTAANLFHRFHGGNSMPWGSSSGTASSFRPNPNYVRPSRAPNGTPWPAKSGYLDGYAMRSDSGNGHIILSNVTGTHDLCVKVFNATWGRPLGVRALFLRKGSTFDVDRLSAGAYDVRFQDLDTGEIRKTAAFALREPSQRISDSQRYFDFEELGANSSATTMIPTAEFGP